MSAWLKVEAHLPKTPPDWSAWAELFERFGLDGTVQTDAPPTISAYAPPGNDLDLRALRSMLESRGAVVQLEDVEETDWSEAWKQFFKPLKVGKRFLIRPTWEEHAAVGDRLEIVLDPGQAFGTGDHPTTRLCLLCLEEVGVRDKTVADIGCGSGILSVGACLLGASHVDAVDIDPVSVEATKANAERNRVMVTAHTGAGFAPLQRKIYGVVVSNIISAAVIALSHEASVHLAEGGSWIVSGIIKDNWRDVEVAVGRFGFTVREVKEEGEWVAAILDH